MTSHVARSVETHPAVRRYRAGATNAPTREVLSVDTLRELCLAAGADDVGFVSIHAPEVDDQRADILSAFPATRTLVSIVRRVNREPLRSTARSAASLELKRGTDKLDEIASELVRQLETRGVRAMNPASAFPMEVDRFPDKMWTVSHKPVAVAAGLGHMGLHRNVIHPQFGSFVGLTTVLVAAEVSELSTPLRDNPCLDCKLCVAACPVGAIRPDGSFHFSDCYTHSYREVLTGFSDFVASVNESESATELRQRVSPTEMISMWQGLSTGASTRSAYCLAVCPAGDDVLGPYVDDKKGFTEGIVRPLQQLSEPVYVLAGSDAHAHVAKRFPKKTPKIVRNGLRVSSIDGFLSGLPLSFRRLKAVDLNATFHFCFSGDQPREATVQISGGRLRVDPGLVGEPSVIVRADTKTWIDIVNGDRSMVSALLLRRVRVVGSLRLLRAFDKCFR